MIRVIYILITYLILCASSQASNLNYSIGTTLSFLKINDPNFKYTNNQDQLQINNISVGLNYKIPDSSFIINAYTNRIIFNKAHTRTVRNKTNGNLSQVKTKVEADTFMLGYDFGKKIIPSFMVGNVTVQKGLYSHNTLTGEKTQHSFYYGLNLSYFIKQDFYLTSSFIAPIEELGLESGVIIGLYYKL